MQLSIIIACYNSAATLGETLDAFTEQRWDGKWEVLIADNGSTDGTRALASSYIGRVPSLRIIDAAGQHSAAWARNVAARHARGDALAFCDSDDVVAPDWLAAISAALEYHDIVASRFELGRLNGAAEKNLMGDHPQQHGLQHKPYAPQLAHAGAGGMGIRRKLFEQLGGFDLAFTYEEDTDLCFRAQLHHSATLFFAEDAVLHVRARADVHKLVRQFRNWGRYDTVLRNRYRTTPRPMSAMVAWLAYIRSWGGILLWLLRIRRRAELLQCLRVCAYAWGQLEGSLTFHMLPR